MQLDEALVRRLMEDTAVAGIVETRIHWVRRPQGKGLPALVLRQVGGSQDDPLEGSADLVETRVQIEALAETHMEASALARAVRAALVEPAAIDAFEFWNADPEGPIDLSEDTADGFVHRITRDFLMRHSAEA